MTGQSGSFLIKSIALEIHPDILSVTDRLLYFLLSVNMQGTTFLAVTLLVLLVITFAISGSEVALFSLNKKDIDMLKTKQHASAKRIVTLLEEPKEVYASLLIDGTFVNISIIVLSNFLLTELIDFTRLGSFPELVIKVVAIVILLVFIGRIFHVELGIATDTVIGKSHVAIPNLHPNDVRSDLIAHQDPARRQIDAQGIVPDDAICHRSPVQWAHCRLIV